MYKYPIKPDELYHFGTKTNSGRYPWGSGGRPYQRLEKPKRKIGLFKSKKLEQKKKEDYEKKRREEFEKNKESIIKSAGPSEVLKYQGLFDNNELQTISNRLRLESEIMGYLASSNKKEDGIAKLKKIQSYTNASSLLAKDGISIWNSIASVYNSTEKGKKDPLPVVSTGGADAKKQKGGK